MNATVLKQAQAAPPPSPEAQKLLEQLRDIHEPAPISWWPPAPGWWLLALLLLACAAGVYLWLRHKRQQRLHNRYRVEAVELLRSVDAGARMAPQEINEILKRVAVTTYGRTACGNLTGRPWLDFLQDSAEIECPDAVKKVVLQHIYRADNTDKAGNEAFRNYAIEWVQRHRQSRPAIAQAETAEAGSV
ncbi:DUF4381 domain-containing protein [Microbulbifer marinus]|uniref:DUF4381 domain-containing protein n=1 Tax=Microbulbifer marinus TaxID=658218 RepID=A0A1H3VXV6_9GAMM|nr:DUF4381 domain-containing protein [Microbulbifer marinus]SDZ78922.1 protein of unknown function [Microbulbifer marinus]